MCKMSSGTDDSGSDDDLKFARALSLSMKADSSDVIELLSSDDDDELGKVSSAASSSAASSSARSWQTDPGVSDMTPEELIDFHNLEYYNVKRTGYVYGDATDSEYNLVQQFFGNKPAMRELDNIGDMIEEDLDTTYKATANKYLTGYDEDRFGDISYSFMIVQKAMQSHFGLLIDITGKSGIIMDKSVSESLNSRFFEYLEKREKFERQYENEFRAGVVFNTSLTKKSDAFIKLFCEQALELLIARRVRSSGSSSAASSSAAAASSSSSYNDFDIIPLNSQATGSSAASRSAASRSAASRSSSSAAASSSSSYFSESEIRRRAARRRAAEQRRRNWRQNKSGRPSKRGRRLVDSNLIQLRF